MLYAYIGSYCGYSRVYIVLVVQEFKKNLLFHKKKSLFINKYKYNLKLITYYKSQFQENRTLGQFNLVSWRDIHLQIMYLLGIYMLLSA